MTYNKETVVGVIEQIIELTPNEGFGISRLSISLLLNNAKTGLYSKPSLEEVWKEKCMEAEKSGFEAFSFDFYGEHYISKRVFEGYSWSMPLKAEKL
jgi:hypothetical protein